MRSIPNGRLQVVCGPMFAGKSEELLRRVRRAQLAGLAVEVVNHALDDRHAAARVASHSGLSIASRSVPDVDSLVELVGDRELDLLAIDEAQFFGTELVPAVSRLVLTGMSVVVAGLCVTFDGRPFEPLPSLMALAEDVTKLTAVCAVCGQDAVFHQRVLADDVADARVATSEHVGGIESYQARCRQHFGERGRRPV
ncbi:thymidine kinase [Agromyces hippuratus]|uniref:Thymidine kinase n=1 Tax=Agromyces hippuratus TaxID=286438 RepID=A0A852WPG0_9MICO|nr:thymidine kinase [Agromyces hippuratus]NYG19627.1 thymidine kinase [Agromyces hippuratus]